MSFGKGSLRVILIDHYVSDAQTSSCIYIPGELVVNVDSGASTPGVQV